MIDIDKINIEDIFGERKRHYNSLKVAYCPICFSLKIMKTTENEDYCDVCGNASIEYTSIENWIEIAKSKGIKVIE